MCTVMNSGVSPPLNGHECPVIAIIITAASGHDQRGKYYQQNYNKQSLMTHGSVIFISPLKSIGCNDLMTDFGKPRSNDFNRLEGKWANRRL
jgi:hypothetical protein